MPNYTVVVPAYKEQGNITPLTTRLFRAMSLAASSRGVDINCELIVVDDNSKDGTRQTIEDLARQGHNIRLIERIHERGLSSAVIAGIVAAKSEYVLVMDADLQHPPETAPLLLGELEKRDVQFVLGTRYGKGVSVDKDWPLHRRIISWGARLLARPLSSLSDPMSGFFAIRRSVYEQNRSRVSGIGYKIALELFVKCGIKNFREVPFSFAARSVGESKLTGKVIVHYIKHLRQLYWFAYGIVLVLVFFAAVLAVAYVLNTNKKLAFLK